MKTLFLLASLLVVAPAARAQFDFGGLGSALDKAKSIGKMAKGAAGIGPEEEKVIGESVALEIVGQYGGLVRDPAVVARVNLVGRSLARYSGRPDLAWRFAVLQSDTVNAFSAPDGYVFITRGLYELAAGDDVLAGAADFQSAAWLSALCCAEAPCIEPARRRAKTRRQPELAAPPWVSSTRHSFCFEHKSHRMYDLRGRSEN